MTRWDALREAAEKATPGPWHAYSNRQYVVAAERAIAECPTGGGQYIGKPDREQARADAAYIALANPATILSLLSALSAREREVEEAEKALDEMLRGTDGVDPQTTAWLGLGGARLRARELLARLRARTTEDSPDAR